MSRYYDSFNNHPIHVSLTNLQILFSKIEKKDYVDEAILIEIVRMEKVLDMITSIIEDVDPDLCYTPALKSINAHLTNAISNLTNFINTKTGTHISASNDHLTNCLAQLFQIEQYRTSTSLRSASQIAGNLNRTVIDIIESFSGIVESIKKEYEEVRTEKDELASTIDIQIVRLDNSITELQTKFLNAQENRSDEFSSFMEESKASRTELMSGTTKEVSVFVEELKDEYETYFESISKDANQSLDEIESTKDEAEKYFKIMTNVGTSGQFSKYAIREGNFSLWYNIFGIAFMAVAILLAYLLLVQNGMSEELGVVFSRLITISMFFVPATYCVKEGAKHRRKELYFRRMELELATIDTFIENLSPENREDIKKEITRKLFGASNIELDLSELKSKKKSGELTVNDLVEFLKDIGIKKESVIELFKMLKGIS